MNKKIYFVSQKDEEGYAVVAETPNQAKKYVFYAGEIDCDWVDLRCHIAKDKNNKPIEFSTDMKVGHILEPMEGLKLGAYGYVEYLECPVCNQETMVKSHEDGSVMCDDCYNIKEEHL